MDIVRKRNFVEIVVPSFKMLLLTAALFLFLWIVYKNNCVEADATWFEDRFEYYNDFCGVQLVNFNIYERFAGVVFFIGMVSCYFIYGKIPDLGKFIAIIVWAIALGGIIYFAATISTEAIYNNHRGYDTYWHMQACTPIQVALCGIAYAVPMVLGVIFIIEIFNSKKLITSIVVAVLILVASVFSAIVSNMFIYVISALANS